MQRDVVDLQSLLFNDAYQIEKRISEGSFGTVYAGRNVKTLQKVAIKIEKSTIAMFNTLYREAQILKKIQGIEGQDLLQFYKRLRRFSMKTVCKMALQLLSILQNIHERGVVHRDLKPENIVVGLETRMHSLYLLDFGISKEFLEEGKHIPYSENRPFIGTVRFSSISAHKGIELSRKDDLESLGYLLLYFIRGKLPWQFPQKMSQLARRKKVAEVKEKIALQELCQNLPEVFSKYVKYVKNLSFKEKPNYNYLKGLFLTTAEDMKLDLEDGIWDWSETYPSTSLSLSKKSSLLNSDTFPSEKSLEKPVSEKKEKGRLKEIEEEEDKSQGSKGHKQGGEGLQGLELKPCFQGLQEEM